MSKFFVHDCIQGDIELYATEGEAMVAADEALEYYRDGAPHEGWPEGFNIQVGRVTHELKMVGKVERPDDLDEEGISAATGDWWPDNFSYMCDFEFEATPPLNKPERRE